MKKSVYNIAEIANVHGGDFEYLRHLVQLLINCEGVDGIKFQPFKYDRIALPDFKWYPVYEELYFSNQQWREIIDLAAPTKNVWIDTFDSFTTEIIRENFSKIFGVKLQASILYNEVVFAELKEIGLKEKHLILNISGLEVKAIHEIVQKFEKELDPKKLILQIGYQAYPTELADSGLSKIELLKSEFNLPISFADHLDGKSEEALFLPVVAMCSGAEYIEKHVLLDDRETKYDHFSSLSIANYKKMIGLQKAFLETMNAAFIVDAEKKYLMDSRQIPVTNKDIPAGSVLSFGRDLDFKRSNLVGLTAPEILELIKKRNVTAVNLSALSVIPSESMRKARIAAVIACRLKSSRLKRKAVLKIGTISSVELCIKNTLKISGIDNVVLATSNLEEDAELKDYTYDSSVIFHRGDPLDVIQRYLDVLEKLDIDILVRITADMPYVSDEIVQYLLDAHFRTGSDFTRAKQSAVGTAAEIINVSALRKVKRFFPKADYSEYMTFYFLNNPEHFRINEVDLPSELIRDYRLTLDYPEDLDLFNKIEQHFLESGEEQNLLSIFNYLDKNKNLASINSHITLKYVTDKELINTLNLHTTVKNHG